MQKQVSKHSLLVLTLSILLAVSMCLTATFAAFGAQSEITGTVSFQGGIQITANGTANAIDNTYVIDFTVNLANGTATQVATPANSKTALTSVVIDANDAAYYWKATLTLASGAATFNTSASAVTLGGVTETTPRTATVMTWNTGSTPVTAAANNETTLNITNLIAALPLTINYTTIGNAATEAATEFTVTLAIQASVDVIA